MVARNRFMVDFSAIEGLKKAFCRLCVLFKPSIYRCIKGIQFRFIFKLFLKYNNFHSSSKIHLFLNWYSDSISRAKYIIDFMNGKPINIIRQVNSGLHKDIETESRKLKLIISTILFCKSLDVLS